MSSPLQNRWKESTPSNPECSNTTTSNWGAASAAKGPNPRGQHRAIVGGDSANRPTLFPEFSRPPACFSVKNECLCNRSSSCPAPRQTATAKTCHVDRAACRFTNTLQSTPNNIQTGSDVCFSTCETGVAGDWPTSAANMVSALLEWHST